MKFFFSRLSILIGLILMFPSEMLNAQSDLTFVAVSETSAVFSSSIAEGSSVDPPQKGSFNFSGYFDTYYSANLNQPATRTNLGSSGISRGFDRYPGQFQLGMFLTRMGYSHRNTEFVGEVGFGPNIEYGSYGNDFRYRWGTVLANSTYSSILIKQAYITLKPTEKLSFTMGQFGTHIGYEMIDAPLNFHYSINNTFNAGIPFYHVGLKANYIISDRLSLMAGVVNGTDNLNDNNRGKSFIGQIMASPAEGWIVYLNTIQGNEGNSRLTGKDTTSLFGVIDLVSTAQITKRISVTFWAMYGTMKGEYQGSTFLNNSKHWSGINFYTSCLLTNQFSVGMRLEYFDNRDGARALLTNGQGTDVSTATITGNFSLADGRLLLKPEFRVDHFRKMKAVPGEAVLQQFADRHGNFTKNNQSTIGLAAIYKF